MRLLLAAVFLSAVPCFAEQIVMRDGTVVKGELVDFQNGIYTVKVGKFLKTIPEARIADVRPDSATGAAPAAPAADLAQPGVQMLPPAGARPAAAQPIYGGGAAATPVPGVGAALQMLKGANGGAAVSQGSVNQSLKALGASDPSIAAAVQQMMSGGAPDMNSLQQLQNNPAMEKLVERFRDPQYQKQLIDGLRNVQSQEGGQPNPMLDQLQGLFQQLNTLQGQPQR